MDIRTLSYFVVIAEELNITKAAEKLCMSQPPLSSQMKALEEELDTTLFIRGKRHLQLTESGKPKTKSYCYKGGITDFVQYLNEGKIVIITGFQGIDKLGNITTLGRGGSDLSAVAIASSMKAKKCEIYSDIDGIFSADPKIIPNATLIPKISYDEMLEASSNGAKVLHNRCVSLAKKYKVKIISKNTFNNSLGSTVQDTSEDLNVHFITKKENLTKICIVGSLILENSNVLNNIYTIANKLNTKIYMITTNELSINIIVDTAIANSFIQELHNTLIIKEE